MEKLENVYTVPNAHEMLRVSEANIHRTCAPPSIDRPTGDYMERGKLERAREKEAMRYFIIVAISARKHKPFVGYDGFADILGTFRSSLLY